MIEIIITSSILIIAILLIRLVLKGKISRKLQYGLWLIVLIRLALPISIATPISVLNVVDTNNIQYTLSSQRIVVNPLPEGSLESFMEKNDLTKDEALIEPAYLKSTMSAKDILLLVWIAGMGATLIWFIVKNILFGIKLHKERKPYVIESCKLPVFVVNFLISPCLFGIIRPVIYLTPKALETKESVSHILAHEMGHYRHLDYIWSILRMICICVYWFNPLVWIGAVISRADCELACDEAVVKAFDIEQRVSYGRTLVGLIPIKSSVSSIASTATTMTTSKRNMKERIDMIVKSQKKKMISALVAVICMVVVLVGCTFTKAPIELSKGQAIDELAKSIKYENKNISFTIPKGYKDSKDWNIQIYGRSEMGEDEMSVHFLELENENKDWQADKEYSMEISPEGSIELIMEISLWSDNTLRRSIDLLSYVTDIPEKPLYNEVEVNFPAYQEGKTEQNAAIYEANLFKAILALPSEWEVRMPEDSDGSNHPFEFYTPLHIYEGDRLIAFIGYNIFEPYQDEIAPEDYYKTVYTSIRLGSSYWWNPYKAVKTSEFAETGIAVVEYLDPDEIDKPVARVDVPHIVTSGILSYNKNLGVYIGIQFKDDAGVSDEQMNNIANSIELVSTTDEKSLDSKGIHPVNTTNGEYAECKAFGNQDDGIVHKGIDYKVPAGTPVVASLSGKVSFSGHRGAYGQLVIIDHESGLQTYYAHNKQLLVKAGQLVKQGEVIANSGSTGRTTGNCCHFEVRINDIPQNPMDFIT